MLGQQLVILSDAHLGASPKGTEEALLAFLDRVPTLGDCLLINGDLFDFWFAYRRVIPRNGFHVVSALARLAPKIPVVMTGGNHDRWGDSFWDRDLGIRFSADSLRFQIGDTEVLAVHGDGIAESSWAGSLIHALTKHPLTVSAWRLIHPDLGFRLMDLLSGPLADGTRDVSVRDRATERQRAWALAELARDPSIGLLVMGHTHRPALHEFGPGRHYINPGAWLDGMRYAIATPTTVTLEVYR